MKIVAVKTNVLGTDWRNLTFVRVITDNERGIAADAAGHRRSALCRFGCITT